MSIMDKSFLDEVTEKRAIVETLKTKDWKWSIAAIFCKSAIPSSWFHARISLENALKSSLTFTQSGDVIHTDVAKGASILLNFQLPHCHNSGRRGVG